MADYGKGVENALKMGDLSCYSFLAPYASNSGNFQKCVQTGTLDGKSGNKDVSGSARGNGKVDLWDHGDYEVEEWLNNRIVIKLNGEKTSGRFCLIKFKKAGEKTWLLFALREE